MHPCTDTIIIRDSDDVDIRSEEAGTITIAKKPGHDVKILRQRGHKFYSIHTGLGFSESPGTTHLYCERCGEVRAIDTQ